MSPNLRRMHEALPAMSFVEILALLAAKGFGATQTSSKDESEES